MALKVPDPQQAVACLRAIKTVITNPGPMADAQRVSMELAQRHFLQTKEDLDALAPIDAGELARAIESPELRQQLVQVMCAYVLLGKDVRPSHLAAIKEYARALDLDDPAIDHLRYLIEDRLRLLRFDFRRRGAVGEAIKHAYKEGGLRGVFDTVMQIAGHGEDPALLARFHALSSLPEGTLGHGLHRFYEEHKYSFPGDKDGTPLALITHDLAHVLAGYKTDLLGEVRTLAFQSGFKRDQPLMFIFLLLYQIHIGVEMVQLVPGSGAAVIKDQFDDPVLLEEAWKAHVRGAAMNRDLMDGTWDFWADLPRPVHELRDRFGIPAA